MAGQHWMLSVGVLWWFYTAPGCEKPCECQVQLQPPGIVLSGMVVVAQLLWQPQTVTSGCGQAWLCARRILAPELTAAESPKPRQSR